MSGDQSMTVDRQATVNEISGFSPAATTISCPSPVSTTIGSSAPAPSSPASSTPSTTTTTSRGSTPVAAALSSSNLGPEPDTPATTTSRLALRALAQEVAPKSWRPGNRTREEWIDSWARCLEDAAAISPHALAWAIDGLKNPKVVRLYACQQCGQKFLYVDSLADHALSVHDGILLWTDGQPYQRGTMKQSPLQRLFPTAVNPQSTPAATADEKQQKQQRQHS